MATRKQRKRREKEHRHEYVWEDGEGNPIEPEELPGANGKAKREPVARAKGGGGQITGRGGRVIHPPSWRRTFRRAAIFAPIFLVIILLLNGSRLTIYGAILNTILLVAIFVPFSYFMDQLVYRQHQKRLAKRGER
jgi:TRAP-type uncharacterized transport system fused permease subunit